LVTTGAVAKASVKAANVKSLIADLLMHLS